MQRFSRKKTYVAGFIRKQILIVTKYLYSIVDLNTVIMSFISFKSMKDIFTYENSEYYSTFESYLINFIC